MSDYISREAAILVAMDYDGNGNGQDASMDIAGAIGDIPAADVVERKACHDTEESRIFRCSECGYGVNDIFEDKDAPVYLFERFEHWRFCPCCGAQIKEAPTNANG